MAETEQGTGTTELSWRARNRGRLVAAGAVLVTAGVFAHFPALLHEDPPGAHGGHGAHGDVHEASTSIIQMEGMGMSTGMVIGMVIIALGLVFASLGLAPADRMRERGRRLAIVHTDERLTPAHRRLAAILVVALVIDIMKPISLSFVLPGLRDEYGLTVSEASVLPLVALTGTVIGSVVWGRLADRWGRQPTIVLAAMIFIATSICGVMPTFGLNLVMCFVMGLSAGGMLPLVLTLLTEIAPTTHRGRLAVLIGGVGAIGGYLAASGAASLLVPEYGWRVLWLLGLPTGVALVALSRYIPESPHFLAYEGRRAEGQAVLERYGARFGEAPVALPPTTARAMVGGRYRPRTVSLMVYATAWGLANFGFLIWLPTQLELSGLGGPTMLAWSALAALPGAVLVAWLYHRWSSKYTLVLFAALIVAALLLVSAAEALEAGSAMMGVALALLILASSAAGAMLLPYTAEVFPTDVRATAAGLVAAATKLGALVGPMLVAGVLALSSVDMLPALILAVPVAIAALLLARAGVETQGRTLDEITLDLAGDRVG